MTDVQLLPAAGLSHANCYWDITAAGKHCNTSQADAGGERERKEEKGRKTKEKEPEKSDHIHIHPVFRLRHTQVATQ